MARTSLNPPSAETQFESTHEVIWACLTTLQRHGNDNPRLLVNGPYQAAVNALAAAYRDAAR
jgi:hypothetical protein